MHREIRTSWFYKCKVGAETRGIEWALSLDLLWEIFLRQKRVCALSGLPIGWASVGQNHTASIDRIDSREGYVEGNVQLVHKDVNMMKQSFSQARFLELCCAVAIREVDSLAAERLGGGCDEDEAEVGGQAGGEEDEALCRVPDAGQVRGCGQVPG
jgi:hypothetical protein